MKDCNSCKYRELTIWEGDPCERCKGYNNWKPKDKFSELWDKFMNKELVVNCQTEEEAKSFMAYCQIKGLTWVLGDKPTQHTYWNNFKKNIFYTSKIAFDSIKNITKDDGYEVATYSEMFGEGKEMEKEKIGLAEIMLGLKYKYSLKFVRLSDGLVITADEEGNLVWESGHKKLSFNDEFRKVQEPVPFMEAANSNKRIRPNDEDSDYDFINDWVVHIFPAMTTETYLELINGKWFVEDAE